MIAGKKQLMEKKQKWSKKVIVTMPNGKEYKNQTMREQKKIKREISSIRKFGESTINQATASNEKE